MADDEFHRFTYEDALLEAMVVMMLVDRDIDDAEIDRLRAGFWQVTASSLTDETIQNAIDRASVGRVTDGIRRLRYQLDPTERETILSSAIVVASADGSLGDVEYDMAVLLGEALGFDEMEMRAIWQKLA